MIRPPIMAHQKVEIQGLPAMGQAPLRQPMNF